MASRLEQTKIYIEIIAIVAAGIFTFFTWGISYLSLQDPNWDMALNPVNLYTAVEKEGAPMLCLQKVCDTISCCEFSATLEVKNNGNKPFRLDTTTVEVYFLKRKPPGGLVNNAVYEYIKNIKATNTTKKVSPDLLFHVLETDEEPVYPNQPAWRPFSFDLNSSRLKEKLPLAQFARRNVLLIIVKQKIIIPKWVFFNDTKVSTLSYLNSNICNLNQINRQIKATNPIR